jgi:hypothetical protein
VSRNDEGGKEIRHHYCGPLGQRYQRRRYSCIAPSLGIVGGPLEIESVLDATSFEVAVQVDHSFQDERMNAIARPGIVVAQAVVYEHRQPKLVALIDGELEREVVVSALGSLHPVEHHIPAPAGTRYSGCVDAEIVDTSHTEGRRGAALCSISAARTSRRSRPPNTS